MMMMMKRSRPLQFRKVRMRKKPPGDKVPITEFSTRISPRDQKTAHLSFRLPVQSDAGRNWWQTGRPVKTGRVATVAAAVRRWRVVEACITLPIRILQSGPYGQCVRSPQNLPQIGPTVSCCQLVQSLRSRTVACTVDQKGIMPVSHCPYGFYGQVTV